MLGQYGRRPQTLSDHLKLVLKHLDRAMEQVPDELLSFIAPGHRENINFFGFISVAVEVELAKLIEGWRPLRPATVTEHRLD